MDFQFAGMDLRHDNSTATRARDGADDEGAAYARPSRRRSAPVLAPGRYTLRVESTNRDGVWSRQAAILPFRILPPFYATWWFRSLLVLAAALIGLTLHRMRVRQILRLERLRSRIAGDLHDEIGADAERARLARRGRVGARFARRRHAADL